MNTKLTWALFWLVWWFVLWGTYLVYTMWIDTQKVSANPDYICIKDINRSCQIDYSNCTDWNTNWERTCYWKRVTQVAYYNLRTTCEKWYWNGSNVTTASNQVHYSKADAKHVLGIQHWTGGWQWWRHSNDFVYADESCSITQVDTTPPDWETSTGN